MSDETPKLLRRILALPSQERNLATSLIQQLVAKRRAEKVPLPKDPIALARILGLHLDPWQIDVLTSSSSRLLLNCARQTGKSTVTALMAVSTAHLEPNALILLLSPSLRQSNELFKKALDIHSKLTTPGATVAQSTLHLELKNRSRIISLPGKENTIRGFSGVDLLAIDEAARVSDDLYYSVRPMLAVSRGRLIALSTPFGTRGWWFDAWRSSQGWERYEIPASRCPRIPDSFLEEERRALGEWWYAQEYECQFLDAETQPFGREDVEQAFTEEVQAWSL